MSSIQDSKIDYWKQDLMLMCRIIFSLFLVLFVLNISSTASLMADGTIYLAAENNDGEGSFLGIYRGTFGGSSVELVSDCGVTLDDIVLDPMRGIVFTVSAYEQDIMWIKLAESGSCQSFHYYSLYIQPKFLAVDPGAGYLYWSVENQVAGTAQIYRKSYVDPGAVAALLVTESAENHDILGITLDPIDGKLYWSLYGSSTFQNSIKRSNLDGSEVEVVTDTTLAFSYYWKSLNVDLRLRQLYWYDVMYKEVRRLDLPAVGADIPAGGLPVSSGPLGASYQIDYSADFAVWHGRDLQDQVEVFNCDTAGVTLHTRIGDGSPMIADWPSSPLNFPVYGIVIDPVNGSCSLDSDGDKIIDCLDPNPYLDDCPEDPEKSEPGQCGCGVADTDTDRDGTADCNDQCAIDPDKIIPGICGCGAADTDTDGDRTPNCNDSCPLDPNKVSPGLNGCGYPEDPDNPTDSDGDGTPDVNDGCPADPNKQAAGQCGCGIPEEDQDRDQASDCIDHCPGNSAKWYLLPGSSCGTVGDRTDSDRDGLPDPEDQCEDNENKDFNDPDSICGDKNSDYDSDNDGVPDRLDYCVFNPNKSEFADRYNPCGSSDDTETNTDGDAAADWLDECISDSNKIEYGGCSCGQPDPDRDSDGVPDCVDNNISARNTVTPDHVPIRPFIDIKGKNENDAVIYLERFKRASLNSGQRRLIGLAMMLPAQKGGKKKSKLSFRYKVHLTATDLQSNFRKKRTVRKNRVVFKRLKPGRYRVKYRVQITKRKKVVAQTPYSPSNDFTIN